MMKMFFVFLCLASSVFAGGLPGVKEEEEKEVMVKSHTVFEAMFVEQQITYLLKSKPLSKKEFYKAREQLYSNEKFKSGDFKFKMDITLLVMRAIKGGLKKHQTLTISFEDSFTSECPHIADYGNYRAKQIYYDSSAEGKNSYRYRTVGDIATFSTLVSSNIILGKLGFRLGKEVEIVGSLPKDDEGDFFSYNDGLFEVSRVDRKEVYTRIPVVLDTEYEAAGGLLPKVGENIILKGYEGVVVIPFSKEHEDKSAIMSSNNMTTQFVVTKVIHK